MKKSFTFTVESTGRRFEVTFSIVGRTARVAELYCITHDMFMEEKGNGIWTHPMGGETLQVTVGVTTGKPSGKSLLHWSVSEIRPVLVSGNTVQL